MAALGETLKPFEPLHLEIQEIVSRQERIFTMLSFFKQGINPVAYNSNGSLVTIKRSEFEDTLGIFYPSQTADIATSFKVRKLYEYSIYPYNTISIQTIPLASFIEVETNPKSTTRYEFNPDGSYLKTEVTAGKMENTEMDLNEAKQINNQLASLFDVLDRHIKDNGSSLN